MINNSVLKNADIFHKFELETDEQSKECAVRFENNTKLDARDLCEYDPFGKLFSVIFRGNSKDCGNYFPLILGPVSACSRLPRRPDHC